MRFMPHPLQKETYWVQHGLVAVAPLYITWLMNRETGGKHARGYLSTAMISYAILCFYHFIVLQGWVHQSSLSSSGFGQISTNLSVLKFLQIGQHMTQNRIENLRS